MPLTEKLFMFNPFNIKNWKDEEVAEQYEILNNSLSGEDTAYSIAYDIELYANMGYLIGEMIARYYQSSSIQKVQTDSDIQNSVYRLRESWTKTSPEKPPAMSYFEAKAQTMYLDDLKSLVEKEANLKRFKFAYDSIESKQNALKKKLESLKFDTFGK